MKSPKYTLEDVKRSVKKKDAWWTVFLVDPIVSRLTLPLANYTNITPNQISILAFIVGLASASFFYIGTYTALVTGAVLYHFSFILDCIDGKLARLTGKGSMFGAWLDYILDRTRVSVCAFALMCGQFVQTGDITYLYLIFVICFLDGLRYLDALLVYRIRHEMPKQIKKAQEALPETMRMDEMDFEKDFKTRFQRYMKIRAKFMKKRVRMHLFSGIEYQMFIFIIAPLFGWIKEMVVIGSVLLLMFEIAFLYKWVWIVPKTFEAELQKIKDKINQFNESTESIDTGPLP